MIKEWDLLESVPNAKAYAEEIGESTLVAGILWHRGIRTKEEALAFLHPDRSPYSNPFDIKDMDVAIRRIQQAIQEKQHITIYGDYDVDGMTATSLLLRALRKAGAEATFYIPDRMREGYGFNRAALEELSDMTDLLISVDCGVASVEDVKAVREKLDIIITDHHLPGPELPPALAVINPHREDCPSKEKDLCGVGVVFKLCQALWTALGKGPFEEDLELVTIGTVADLVPLRGENRKIVKEGLSRMRTTGNKGIAALIEVAGLQGKDINAGHVGFMLAPRLNASGRIGTAKKGVALLTAEDASEASQLAMELDLLNTERQAIERDILEKAVHTLEKGCVKDFPAIVVAGENWNPGVIGIVASRLVDRYYKPAIVFDIQEDGTCKGSCRSIKGLHMFEALQAMSEHIEQFGGHEMAAGLTVKREKLSAFREAFARYCKEHLTEAEYIPRVSVEFELAPKDITFSLVEDLSRLEPYGIENPKPFFGWRNMRASEATAIGKEKRHLRFQAGTKEIPVTALMWNEGNLAGIVNAEAIDIVYYPNVNEWNGRKSLQCIVNSMQPAATERVFPTRDILLGVYRYLRGLFQKDGKIPFSAESLTLDYRKEADISYYTMRTGLQVFQELGILLSDAEETYYTMPQQHGKLDLMSSPTYRRGMRQLELMGGKRV